MARPAARAPVSLGRTAPADGPIAVVHPGVQHSRELVRALHAGGLLGMFVTSLAGESRPATWLPSKLARALRKRSVEGVPEHLVATLPHFEIAERVFGACLGARARARLAYLGLALFDRVASRRIAGGAPRVVVGVENSCLHTFRRAKAAGSICVLDAASVHHSAQPTDTAELPAALLARINSRKDAEIALADRIVVLSAYARDTYAAAGVPIAKLAVIAPGVYLGGALPSEPRVPASGVRFLFAGNVKKAKGIDLLIAAFSRLDAADRRLAIAGPLAEPGALPDPLPPGVEYLGKLERDALLQAYARADVFVLPSRADGFGFVVAEAMGCGLPVIVSSAVGAADLITHDENGWIFASGDAEPLRQAMAAAVSRRSDWLAMGARARQAVEGLTWDTYGDRIRAFYGRLLEESAGNRSAP